MRSSSFRLALPFATLLVVLPLGRLSAADVAPITAAPAPPSAPGPTPTPAASAGPAVEPAPAPKIEPAPTPATEPTLTPSATAPIPDATPSPSPGPVPTPAPVTSPVPVAAPAPAPTPTPVTVADQDTLEAKLAVVLRSYTLLQEENDRLKADQEKYATERAALEAQLGAAKNAMPLAAQAAGLREQLRQTQDQLAALSLENNQLKTRLATGAPAPGTSNLTPMNVPTTLAPAAVPPAPPAPRTHVVVAGETLGKISKQYYGTTKRWPEILAANRDVLKDEKSVFVGLKLKIP